MGYRPESKDNREEDECHHQQPTKGRKQHERLLKERLKQNKGGTKQRMGYTNKQHILSLTHKDSP